MLSNVIASQHDLHAKYGGVVPEIASRAHAERLTPVVRAALETAGVSLDQLDVIAVANRPGLIGSLLVGVAAAKALALSLNIPLIGVDHVRAHLSAGLLHPVGAQPALPQEADDLFPALGLVVSGGHSSIYLCKSALELERLGATIDDAIGEAYDKCAAMLGLPHPGGPQVDAIARTGNDRAHDFPISRLAPGSLDFSFSGLKTSVLYTIRGQPLPPKHPSAAAPAHPQWEHSASELSDSARADICASFQRAAIAAVALKLTRAHEYLQSRGIAPRSLLVGGGVSANSRLRTDLASLAGKFGVRLVLPRMEYCLDNAAMIAGLASIRLAAGERDDLSLAASPSGAAN